MGGVQRLQGLQGWTRRLGKPTSWASGAEVALSIHLALLGGKRSPHPLSKEWGFGCGVFGVKKVLGSSYQLHCSWGRLLFFLLVGIVASCEGGAYKHQRFADNDRVLGPTLDPRRFGGYRRMDFVVRPHFLETTSLAPLSLSCTLALRYGKATWPSIL